MRRGLCQNIRGGWRVANADPPAGARHEGAAGARADVTEFVRFDDWLRRLEPSAGLPPDGKGVTSGFVVGESRWWRRMSCRRGLTAGRAGYGQTRADALLLGDRVVKALAAVAGHGAAQAHPKPCCPPRDGRAGWSAPYWRPSSSRLAPSRPWAATCTAEADGTPDSPTLGPRAPWMIEYAAPHRARCAARPLPGTTRTTRSDRACLRPCRAPSVPFRTDNDGRQRYAGAAGQAQQTMTRTTAPIPTAAVPVQARSGVRRGGR